MKCRQFYFTLRRSGLAMLMLLSLAFSAAAMPQQAAKAGFDSYNYGNLKPGSSSQATFTFTVAASISTSVTTLDQFGYAFSIVSDGCTGFSGDGSCNVVVSFTPPFSGYFSAILQFSYLNETEQNAQIYLFGKGSIGASLVCAASVSPDRSLKVATETVVGATFKVKNQGISGSFDQYLEMPFDATLIPAYTSFSDPGMWVSSSEGGKLKIALPSLGAGATFSGTVFFRLNPENMPVAGKELSFNYYVLYSTNALPARDIAWDSSSILLFREESTVTGTCYSNTVKVSFTDGNRDETVGKVMPMTPGETAVTAGTQVTVAGDMFIAGELFSAWITAPNGQSVALAGGRADANGVGSLTVDTTGLAAGSYVIAIYGHDSEITGRTILTVK